MKKSTRKTTASQNDALTRASRLMLAWSDALQTVSELKERLSALSALSAKLTGRNAADMAADAVYWVSAVERVESELSSAAPWAAMKLARSK